MTIRKCVCGCGKSFILKKRGRPKIYFKPSHCMKIHRVNNVYLFYGWFECPKCLKFGGCSGIFYPHKNGTKRLLAIQFAHVNGKKKYTCYIPLQYP